MKAAIKSLWQFCLSNRVIPTTGWTVTPSGILPPPQKPVVRKQFEMWPARTDSGWVVFVEPGSVLVPRSRTQFAKEIKSDMDVPPDNSFAFSGSKSIIATFDLQYDGMYWLCTNDQFAMSIVDHLDVPDDDVPEINSYDESDPPVGTVHVLIGSVHEANDSAWIADSFDVVGLQDTIGTFRLAIDANPQPSGSGAPTDPPSYYSTCTMRSGTRLIGMEFTRTTPPPPSPVAAGGTVPVNGTYWKLRTPMDTATEWVPEPFTRLEIVTGAMSGGSPQEFLASHETNTFLCDATTEDIHIMVGSDIQGYPISAKKMDASANEVVIRPSGSGATVDGASDYRLTTQYASALFVSDDSGNIHILASHA